MQNQPEPMAHEQLVAVLEDILAAVRVHDSFEGSFEYLMPQPAQDHEPVIEAVLGIACCAICGVGHQDVDELRRIHAGDPQTTADGQRVDFMVRASYRVGNSMGQGGMRMIGEMRSDADRSLSETDQSIMPVVGSMWAIVVPNPCRTCGAIRGNYCVGPEGKMRDAVHTQRWLDYAEPT